MLVLLASCLAVSASADSTATTALTGRVSADGNRWDAWHTWLAAGTRVTYQLSWRDPRRTCGWW